MKIINLTPHAIKGVQQFDQDGCTVQPTWPASGQVARVTVTETWIGRIVGDEPEDDMSVYTEVAGAVEGLPDVPAGASVYGGEQETYYLVSRLVAAACPDRPDLLYPTNLERNGAGQVVACGGWGTAYKGPWKRPRVYAETWGGEETAPPRAGR